MNKARLITAVDNLNLDIKIGVADSERLQPRKVRISFKIYQDHCESTSNDENHNYICYAAISEAIKDYCYDKEFKLLEYLCYQLYLLIKSQVGDNKVYIKVEKTNIQYQEISFDAIAEYSDL